MNLDMVDRNSAPEELACIWQSKRVGIITIETEKMWIHFSCDVFVSVSCRGISNSLIFTKAWSMQVWLPVVNTSLYFWKSVFSFLVDSILKWRYQTESFLTACISLVHEPDKPWSSQKPSNTNPRKELRRCCLPIGHNNTKQFLCLIRNQHSPDSLEMVRWESVPRGLSACAWKLSSRLFSRPD